MSVSTDLQAMIWRRLVSDATLTALVDGRVLDRAPVSTQMPFIEFGPSYARRDDAECIRGQLVTMQLDAWSEAQDGRREALLIVDALTDALQGWKGDETVAMGPVQVVLAQVTDDPSGVATHGIVQIELPCEY